MTREAVPNKPLFVQVYDVLSKAYPEKDIYLEEGWIVVSGNTPPLAKMLNLPHGGEIVRIMIRQFTEKIQIRFTKFQLNIFLPFSDILALPSLLELYKQSDDNIEAFHAFMKEAFVFNKKIQVGDIEEIDGMKCIPFTRQDTNSILYFTEKGSFSNMNFDILKSLAESEKRQSIQKKYRESTIILKQSLLSPLAPLGFKDRNVFKKGKEKLVTQFYGHEIRITYSDGKKKYILTRADARLMAVGFVSLLQYGQNMYVQELTEDRLEKFKTDEPFDLFLAYLEATGVLTEVVGGEQTRYKLRDGFIIEVSNVRALLPLIVDKVKKK